MVYYQKTSWTTAKKTDYNGRAYDSKFEAGYAQELDLRLKAKDIKSWEAQKTLDLIINDYIVGTYRIDFVVYHNDGTIEYVETKGYAFPAWRQKWKIFEAINSVNPNVKLTLIKQGKFNMKKIKKLT